MGQQQLILLVLATTIVGLAITTGIRAFGVNSARANAMFDSQVEVVTCELTDIDIIGEIVVLGGEKVGMTPGCPTNS